MKDINILTSNGVDVNKSLELFGDIGTYDAMLEDFLKEVDGKLSSARKYKDSSDMANYAIIVHSLKSDCRYFGMEELADMFYEHEMAGKRCDVFFVKENFDKLYDEAVKMVNVVKKYMGVIVSDTPIESKEKTSSDGECILVVDDSPIVRGFVQKVFDNKYKIVLAEDGQEAISFIDNTPHEKIMCVFLDLNMPGVDGFTVLEYFKNNTLFRSIPVSIITGAEDIETIQRAFTYDIVDMLNKPFDEVKVRAVAEKTIARKDR